MSRLSERFRIGALEVAALSDGAPDRALGGFFHGIEASEWTRAVGISSPDDPVPFNFGTFLVREPDRLTLVDAGYGAPGRELGVDGGGELLLRLEELGVRPDEISQVVITHLHADHCGWLTNDDADGALTFPNAIVWLSRTEVDYWTGAETDDHPMADGARRRIGPVRDQRHMATFDGEFEVSSGLTMIPTPGHTPGHCSVLLASEGEHLLITGDAAHHPVHLEHHDWIPQVDLNPAESERSRRHVAELAADRDALVTGGHFPILTLGRVRRVEGGYRWEPHTTAGGAA